MLLRRLPLRLGLRGRAAGPVAPPFSPTPALSSAVPASLTAAGIGEVGLRRVLAPAAKAPAATPWWRPLLSPRAAKDDAWGLRNNFWLWLERPAIA